MGAPGVGYWGPPGGDWGGDGEGIWWPPGKPRDLRTIKQRGKATRTSRKTSGVSKYPGTRGVGTLGSSVRRHPALVGGCPRGKGRA